MNKTNFVTIVVILGLIAVLLFAGKMFNNQEQKIVLQSADGEQVNTVPNSDIVDNDAKNIANVDLDTKVTDGWQLYTNAELGFAVQYPKEWFVKDYKSDPTLIGFDLSKNYPGGPEWTITREEATGTPEEQLAEILNTTSTDSRYEVTKTEIVHAGYPAVYTTTINNESETGMVVRTIVIPRGKYIYSIITTDYSKVVIENIAIDLSGEGGTALRDRSILFKELGEKKYPETFFNSFRILE